MKKHFVVLTLLLVFPMILAACGGSDMAPADAEKGLEAAFSGNFEEAEKYLCEEEVEEMRAQEEQMQMLRDMGMTVDATCEKDGDVMECNLAMAAPEGTDAPAQEIPPLRANIKDGKLCGEAE